LELIVGIHHRHPWQSFMLLFAAWLFAAHGPAWAEGERPFVHEITMAAPDVIRVEIRESAVPRGKIAEIEAVGKPGTWLPYKDGSMIVLGRSGKMARIVPKWNKIALDRQAVDSASEYGPVGTNRVVTISRKSVPWSNGTVSAGPQWGGVASSFKHYVFLHLDAPLAPGDYQITWPRELLPPVKFHFDDTKTRASSIHINQNGYAPDDLARVGYLALWIPNGADDGAVDFATWYGVKTFDIIDSGGRVAFSGEVRLRKGAGQEEPGNGAEQFYDKTPKKMGRYQNRAGTFVYELNFSAWQNPAEGRYHIRIAGLGVSDALIIDDGAWRKAARMSFIGLYHQRSGMAPDGRFGYSRPADLSPANGTEVFESRMPLPISKEGGGYLDFKLGAAAPWITANVLPEAWGGYHDAGDWDRRVDHVHATYLLLDAFEMTGDAARGFEIGLPPTSSVLPGAIYKDKDFPDIIDEAIWNLDFYRRLQTPEGGIRGGIELEGSPQQLEPSWLQTHKVFAYAPDPKSSYRYAAAAASARKAWDWAEQAPANGVGSITELVENAELPVDGKKRFLEKFQANTAHNRLWAASVLFRLTEEKPFEEIVRKTFLSGHVDLYQERGDAAWEYLRAPAQLTQKSLRDNLHLRIVDYARRFIVEPQREWAYYNFKHAAAPMLWGEGMAPNHTVAAALMHAHMLSGDRAILKVMLNASAHILGANQIGMSFTTGLGARWPAAPLHEDSIAAGVDPPDGITIYGWAPQKVTNYSWLFGPKWAALSDAVESQRISPNRFDMPLYEYFIENDRVIMQSEYTVQQSIATTAALWLYLALANRDR
jgi:Glycosyl hydrolase family 9/Cellulase N-terminal ig-like domain